MKKFHTTANGDKMLIAQMDDDHLKNTIGVYCTRIKSQIQMIDRLATLKESEKILYGFQQSDVNMTNKAAEEINSAASGMSAYIVEACIRDINVSKIVQDAYGRTSSIPRFDTKIISMQIIEPIDNIDDSPF